MEFFKNKNNIDILLIIIFQCDKRYTNIYVFKKVFNVLFFSILKKNFTSFYLKPFLEPFIYFISLRIEFIELSFGSLEL